MSKLVASLVALLAFPAAGAIYIPITDAELARRSPVIVFGEVIDETAGLEDLDGRQMPFTLTTVRVLEVFKGSIPNETFVVRLVGGQVGDVGVLVPGKPEFLTGQQAVLFLFPRDRHPGEYGLTEFALSKFDVMEDSERRRFAVRSIFQSGEDELPENRTGGRHLQSFLEALRAAGKGGPLPEIERTLPKGALVPVRKSSEFLKPYPLWVNFGGKEPGRPCHDGAACLFRWFFDNSALDNGVVSVNGTQTNLTDGSDGIAHVTNAIAKWTAIPSSDVRYRGPTPGGNVIVSLDVATDPAGLWSAPADCSGGVLDSVHVLAINYQVTFRGDATYRALAGGDVRMRKNICSTGYSASLFRWLVLNGIGQTLGLGFSDRGQSTHSTTAQADWNAAVMNSRPSLPYPDAPQTDDIQAIQYYYGTSLCRVDSTTLCLNGGRFRATVAWRNLGTSGVGQAVPVTSESGYFWFSNSANVDLVVKVLDRRDLYGKFWVFYGALSDLEYTITVTDTETGAVKTYFNPQGQLASVVDRNAF